MYRLICICRYMYTYIYMYIHIYIYMYIYICTHTNTHTHTRTHKHTQTHKHSHTRSSGRRGQLTLPRRYNCRRLLAYSCGASLCTDVFFNFIAVSISISTPSILILFFGCRHMYSCIHKYVYIDVYV